MFEISDISVDYHSLMKNKNYIFVTDSLKPIISYQVISDRRDASLRSACIEMNQWKKIPMSSGRLSMKERRCIRFRPMRLLLQQRMMKGIPRAKRFLFKLQSWEVVGMRSGLQIHR